MPINQPIPHLDKQEKGKFTNARPEDREAIMTAQEKTDRGEKLADQKIQDDLVDQTDEPALQSIEKSTATNTNIKVSSLTYYTNLGDNNAQIVATNNNKPPKNQGDEFDIAKVKSKVGKTKKTKQPKLEDNIKQTITQDITGQFKQTKEEEKKIKDTQEKDKQDYLQRAKIGKMQHNKIEQEMYAKEGIAVDAVEDTNTVAQPKKTSFVENLLSLGGLKAEAKGLNNAKYSLVIYANQNTGLALHADSQNNFEYLRLRTNLGTYGQQRWCFDNDTNQIYISNTTDCQGVYGKKCMTLFNSYTYGSPVGMYDCSLDNYNNYGQKWFFDEEGRLSLVYVQQFCLENASGLTNGNNMVIWGCGTGANKRNQDYRAGYSDFGTNMGMTMWAAASGNFQYNLIGHAFVEFWNSYGTHNTFSRWPNADYDCASNYYNNGTLVYSTNNNICDQDSITVDVEIEIKNQTIRNNKYSQFRTYGIYLTKSLWDSVVFGSGFRNNYYNGSNVDIGSTGTYNGFTSQSRNKYYLAQYSFLPSLENVALTTQDRIAYD